MTNPGKLLVIGGGVGGISAIVGLRKLDKTVEIVLIEPKEYMEICYPVIITARLFDFVICSQNNCCGNLFGNYLFMLANQAHNY